MKRWLFSNNAKHTFQINSELFFQCLYQNKSIVMSRTQPLAIMKMARTHTQTIPAEKSKQMHQKQPSSSTRMMVLPSKTYSRIFHQGFRNRIPAQYLFRAKHVLLCFATRQTYTASNTATKLQAQMNITRQLCAWNLALAHRQSLQCQ